MEEVKLGASLGVTGTPSYYVNGVRLWSIFPRRHVIAGRFALVLEYSTGWLSVEQEGRLVPGGEGTGRLRDSMLTVLAGAQLGSGRIQTQILGGISHVLGTQSSDGVPVDDASTDLRRQVLTVGADVVRSVGARASLLVTLRVYPRLERSEQARELGVGREVYRAGVGVRLALGNR